MAQIQEVQKKFTVERCPSHPVPEEPHSSSWSPLFLWMWWGHSKTEGVETSLGGPAYSFGKVEERAPGSYGRGPAAEV